MTLSDIRKHLVWTIRHTCRREGAGVWQFYDAAMLSQIYLAPTF
jgi:hypothetical protein